MFINDVILSPHIFLAANMFAPDYATRYENLIVLFIILASLLARLSALIPQVIRQRIPFIPILSGILGFCEFTWLLSIVKTPLLLKLFSGVPATVFGLLLANKFINMQFIWGFYTALYLAVLTSNAYDFYATKVPSDFIIVTPIICWGITVAAIICWTFIPKKMQQHFDKVQISLIMFATIWGGIVLGLLSNPLIIELVNSRR